MYLMSKDHQIADKCRHPVYNFVNKLNELLF